MNEDKVLQKVIEIEEEVSAIKEKVGDFLTPDEFNAKMDKALTILNRLDNERIVVVERVKNVETDLKKLKAQSHIA